MKAFIYREPAPSSRKDMPKPTAIGACDAAARVDAVTIFRAPERPA